MTFPFANQSDHGPRICREKRHWDAERFERTERRTGACQCPQCGLWWPSIEEPDMWDQNEMTGRWDASGWWGGVVCLECDVLIVDQPDGTGEVYDLSRQWSRE